MSTHWLTQHSLAIMFPNSHANHPHHSNKELNTRHAKWSKTFHLKLVKQCNKNLNNHTSTPPSKETQEKCKIWKIFHKLAKFLSTLCIRFKHCIHWCLLFYIVLGLQWLHVKYQFFLLIVWKLYVSPCFFLKPSLSIIYYLKSCMINLFATMCQVSMSCNFIYFLSSPFLFDQVCCTNACNWL